MSVTEILTGNRGTLTKSLVIDDDGLIIEADPGMCHYLQEKDSELVGMALSDLVERPNKIHFINKNKISALTERAYVDLSFIVKGGFHSAPAM